MAYEIRSMRGNRYHFATVCENGARTAIEKGDIAAAPYSDRRPV